MKLHTVGIFVFLIGIFVLFPAAARAGVVKVSTADSLSQEQFHGDGKCDEEEINAAIASLPPVGGTVVLSEGTYNICAVPGTYGGITISKSNVKLAGVGPGTFLRLSDEQNTNVIRIIGEKVENIIISDMRIDANRKNQSGCDGDPKIAHSRFECTGIKAYYRGPREVAKTPEEDSSKHVRRVWVRRVQVEEGRLNVMLAGRYMYVLDSYIGDATSDGVEILVGPGQISRNTVVLKGKSGFGLTTDAADMVQINENLVHVRAGAAVSQPIFRTWQGQRYHTLNDNLVYVDPKARVTGMADLRGQGNVADGNLFVNRSKKDEKSLVQLGRNTVMTNTMAYNTQVQDTESEYMTQSSYTDSVVFVNQGNLDLMSEGE